MSNDKIPIKNNEGYVDMTAHDALTNVMNQQKQDYADHRHWRLIRTLENVIDLMGYDLLNNIEVMDRKSGRIYKC